MFLDKRTIKLQKHKDDKQDVHRKGALHQLLYFYIFITFIMSSNIGG
jgi:hypothetical protein